MKISIIIVNYNSEMLLRQSLKSVYEQTKGVSFEVIVIDNASHGNCRRSICPEFSEVQLIESGQNLGFSRANNLGAENAGGEFLAFVNPDIEIGHNVSKAIEYLDGHPHIGILGIRLVNPDGSWQRSYGNFPNLWRRFCDAFFISKLFKDIKLFNGIHKYKEYKKPMEVDWVSGAFMIIKKDAFKHVGGFDKDFFLYLEDIDLCKRTREGGWKVMYFPDIEAVHYIGGESKLSGDFVVDHGDSPYIYFRKHYGRYSLLFLWFIIIFESVFKTTVFFIANFFSKKFNKPLSMYWNTLRFTFLRAPILLVKLCG